MTMITYDLCLAWNWEYDADFVHLLEETCQSQGLSLLQITPKNLSNTLQSLNNKEIIFRTFFDRASDADERFLPLVQWTSRHTLRYINFYELACRSWDKVAMHHAISMSLPTPHTLILPSYDEQPFLPAMDLSSLGALFTIKPAYGGGGDGVITEATTLDQVLLGRQEFPAQRYLLQAHIVPAAFDSRMAWFRVIHCAGTVFPCWWDNSTHLYIPVTSDEEDHYNLFPLRSLSSSIARISGLELFSTEMALTPDGNFLIIDYVNDPIDLRLQSKTADGVPDEIVRGIIERLIEFAIDFSPVQWNETFIPRQVVA